ncbi:MAG TPA: PucR family transcriptional regulator ligand-binding domain-containing protein [Thermoleophilia bacterium]|nr:PucR family transcriptional regulator ligand-binding domain-containing protein [Acidobacteriota bacterium]HOU29323.1 PucR family transcriptional regulator ligand-binding domain-containing protein [Thermoleophilia bacterium]HQF51918.1 PucR family transcriptional regulator ligand-binding domain-containing protein [Thermoleophilia bacterium]HQJ25762.1 PucR family transcriptional regulator ligand-binding domain-containing protein [Thermoleophilia bacterium]
MITVQDILEIPELDLRLLAGKASVSNPVRWVHISEVPDPTKWLKGGELLLTTGYSFAGDEADQVEQIKRLIDHNISGLGFGTGFSFDKVPAALVRVAEEYGFPLFEVPYHVPFLAISEAVASKIVNEQYSLLQRSLAVHEKLTKIVLEEKGLEAILSTLAALVGCSAVLFDFHGVVLCEAAYRRRLGADTVADLWRMIGDRRADRQNFALSMDGAGSSVQVYPVVASHRIGAFLAVVKDSGDFSEYDRIILHNVVTVTALELVKKKAVAETEKRLAGDFFDELIASDLYEEEIARRLAFFGLDAQLAHLIVLVDIDEGEGDVGERGEAAALDVKERLHWTVDEFMARRDVLSISASRSDSVVVLVQPGEADAAEVIRLAGELQGVVAEMLPEISVSIGIGRPHRQLTDLRQSYYEASYAIRIRRLKDERAVIASFDDLGSYGLLLGLQDTLSLEVFYDSVLGRLRDYDAQNSSDLVKSLASFLEANGHWGDAAEKLFVHRHTLRYRMKRVEEITGRDLGSSQDRMEFWLALKARELIDQSRKGKQTTA